MIIETLRTLFKRDLAKLMSEVEAYPNEESLWIIDKEILNSAGNLCLHLVGNLNGFIGAELGGSGYIRQRDLEFSSKNVPRQELLKQISDTITIVDNTLSKLKDSDLEKEFPLLVLKEKTSTGYFLLHLAVHLGYHLGQVNYHRRLLAK